FSDMVLEEPVTPRLSHMQNCAMRCSKVVVTVAHIAVVYPDVFVNLVCVIIKVFYPEVGVVLRVVDDEQVRILLHCSKGFRSPFDAPIDVFSVLSIVGSLVVSDAHIIIRISEDAIDRLTGNAPKQDEDIFIE